MPSAADRLDLAPQRDPGALRSFGLALLVHALLIGALTWGINWKHSDPDLSFEAELWSSVPQEAAPKLVEPPPAPPPPPPPPEPVVKAPPPPPAPDVDIALEREKKRKLELKKKEEELAKAKAEQDRLKELQAKKEKEQKLKDELAKRKAEEAKKAEAKKVEDKKLEAKETEKQKLADAATKKLRDDAMKRMMAQAGATGGADATGSAQKARGPSASYKGRLAALFKRNISFANPEGIQGNPKAIVQVEVSPTGVIMSSKLSKSSGVPAWDEAVLRAVEKTGRIPADETGKIVSGFPIEFGPKD
ncbi:MAG: cell envelope integrity protein TolA [Pseudomonadota bacterium]|uniref:cell envelope integrity protein TolA n=1 Tax=Polaromonas sp. TaxID=1869339 RepID=UPI0017C37026|nr:cell envelope integrity protein TolA [Polaromonas sp.]MBA3593835.1 cell envelope integrity protein TolA [Polaromonas sp.]MDQ3272811.1 cell envelope integrity protein TolA [Pseudomonadota bacterium]